MFRDATVTLNGHLLGRNLGGYAPFRFGVTDVAKVGGSNVLVVPVDASEHEGWFYEGAGIHRHVWLVKTAPVHVPQWGTYVTAKAWYAHFAARPWLAGGFIWTGFDYRGEPTPYQWPCISSHVGVRDTCGNAKDLFHYSRRSGPTARCCTCSLTGTGRVTGRGSRWRCGASRTWTGWSCS